MTDAVFSQVGAEVWINNSANAVFSQAGTEAWYDVKTSALFSQVGVEVWIPPAPPPPAGTFTCGLAQRWDVGQWDQATWDGQIGICGPGTSTGQFTVNPGGAVTFVLGHLLSAQKGAIVVTGYPVGLLSGRSFDAHTGSIVVSGTAAGFSIGYRMVCEMGQIRLNSVAAQVTLTAFLQPGPTNYGIPRVVVPMRW